MKISEIKELSDGAQIANLSGLVENVYPRKAGTTKKGRPYSFQGIILKDATGTIKVTLDGRKECPASMKGKQISLSSVRGPEGLTGVTLTTEEYPPGTFKKIVNATNVAGVQVVGGSNGGSDNPSAAPASKQMVLGQTVGMAINNAVQVILIHNKGMDYFVGDDFIYDLHAVASSIIHVRKALESGEELKRPQEPAARKETHKQEESTSDTDGNFLEGTDAASGPF